MADPFTGAPVALRADRFRAGEFWRRPDGSLYVVKAAPVPGHVFLVEVRTGRHDLVSELAVRGFRRGQTRGRA